MASWAGKNVKLDNATAMNKIRVHPVHLARLVRPEKMDYLETMASKGRLDPLVLLHHGSISRHRPAAVFAHPDLAVQLVQLVHRAPAVRKVYLVKRAEMETTANRALSVMPDPRVKLASQALPDRKVTMVVTPRLTPKDRQVQ